MKIRRDRNCINVAQRIERKDKTNISVIHTPIAYIVVSHVLITYSNIGYVWLFSVPDIGMSISYFPWLIYLPFFYMIRDILIISL